jgi:flagellar hook-associated protein 3 FlgL
MRISTNMIFARGVAAIQQQSAQLLQTQQQVSTGRRIVTPADDPIASARALEVQQSKAVNSQFAINRGNAEDNLNLLENRLVGIGDILQDVRERAVQAGNGALSSTELGFIATEARSQFDALLALANSQNASGEFVFSGFKAGTRAFDGNVAGVSYAGDQGVRTIQVSASRFMPVSLPGSELFQDTRDLANAIQSFDGAANSGTGAVALAFNPSPPALGNVGRRYEIEFDGTDYNVFERVPGQPGRTTVAAPASLVGSTLSFNGIDATVSGAPAAGDAFEVFVASKSVFDNLSIYIDALEQPGPSKAAGAVAFALENVDAGLENVLRVRATVGTQLVEVENLQNLGTDLDLQFSQTLSRLQDVDFAEAISRLTQQQTFLEAAQQSFLRVSNLSLFNFLS